MAIKLETLTFKQHDDVKTRKKKLNKKPTVAPEDASKRHSIHDMILTENFLLKDPIITATTTAKKRISAILLHDEPLQLEVSKSTSMLSLSDSKAYTNVVSFLRTSAVSTKNKITTTSGNLMRNHNNNNTNNRHSSLIMKKRRNTNSSHITPDFFLQEPPQQRNDTNNNNNNNNDTNPMYFFNLLLETMLHGGYITPNLYISKELWYQPNLRFTAIDTKISICETIRKALQNMNERTDFSDSISIEQDLTVFEITLKSVDRLIKRKLGSSNDSSFRRSASFINDKNTQTIHQWGSKISKIKFDTNQQNTTYIQSLIDIFTLAKLFEIWNTKIAGKNEINHMQACINLFITIMNKFVINDYKLLLDKWLSQNSSQFLDLE